MSSQDFCDSEDFQDLKPSKARYSKTTMKVLRLLDRKSSNLLMEKKKILLTGSNLTVKYAPH